MSQNKGQNGAEDEPKAVEAYQTPQNAKKEPPSKPKGKKKAKKRGFFSRLFGGGYKIFKRR